MKKLFHKHKHTPECKDGNCPQEGCGEFFVPISILIGAALIAGSILYTNRGGSLSANILPSGETDTVQQGGGPAPSLNNVAPVSGDDYVMGDRNAPVTIVEYSDIDCPFCRNFHETMKQVVEKYDGEVSWVYRHAPLDELHPNARKKAEAAECVGELGGNDAFWRYLDALMVSEGGGDTAELATIASSVGVNASNFTVCFESGKYGDKVRGHFDNAVQAGFRGTPYSVVLVNGRAAESIPGALPLTLKGDPSGQPGVSEILDGLLENL